MLGIRLTFTEHQSSWLKDGTAAWFWPAAEAAGVPVMIHGREIAHTVGKIAVAHPTLRLILDHMGLNAGMAKAGRCAEGIAAMLPLAKLPNVSVKVSSAPTYSADAFPFRDMDDHIRRLVEAFGPERCFWGTDYTHSPEKCSYRQRLTHFTEHLEFLSAQDKNLITGSALLKCLGWHSAPQTSLPASVKKGIVQ
jgi:predicted TIM-barrel fold metal-dependent hydrolase